MLRTSENETEILLGNKQLLAIFFVAAALLGVAFYGGYKVGRNGAEKKSAPLVTAPPQRTASATNTSTQGGETHSFPSDTTAPADQQTAQQTTPEVSQSQEAPLGSPKRKSAEAPPSQAPSEPDAAFTPQPGEQFLQVAAVGKDEAEGVADVLQKKGFLAHAVPKPGNSKIYRVLIGPVRDAADLSSTRDALRRTGFREVITQKY